MERLQIQVRQLGRADATEYRSIRLFALRDSPTSFGSSYDDESALPLEAFAKPLDAISARTVFGAFLGHELVGIVGIEREQGVKERHKALLRSMFVAPEHRGAGVGRQLLDHALACIGAMPGIRQVTLAVTESNSAAVSLYESSGFRQYGREPDALLVDGVYVDELLMIKNVVAA